MSGISHDKFAKPMLEGDDYLRDYAEEVEKLLQDGTIPGFKEKKRYKVYSIQGSSFGSHKSIVLTADDQRFFTVELGFIKVDGVKRIYPVTRKLSPDLKGSLVYHGEIEGTAGDLISKAVAVMQNFGNYFKLCKNCQDYCNYYLDEIGLASAETLTDGDKLTLLGIAGGIFVVLLKLLQSALKT